MALKGFVVAVLAVLISGQLASSQTLTLSDCAVSLCLWGKLSNQRNPDFSI
jgi:hypothetical protein